MQKKIQNKKMEAQDTKQEQLRDFFFPSCGITIRATSKEEAEQLLNKQISK